MKKLKAYGYYLIMAIFLWVAITSIIQRFKCPDMTETRTFLRIPNSFVLDWYEC